MRVRFWGTRGSIATPGAGTVRYGGNTSCVEVVTNSGQQFIIDCGTGARPLGMQMMAQAPEPIRATILLGHTHWDHIQGFPFFMPVFVAGNEFTICAPSGVRRSLADVMAGQMEFTYFPVELSQLAAKIACRELSEGSYDFEGVRVYTQPMNHPATSLAYRIEADGVTVVYMCDHEPYGTTIWPDRERTGRIEHIVHAGDRRHAAFMQHADLVIHDAQYTPEEYVEKKNWGHSTYEYVVELAAAADVRQLALTHHEPIHDDAAVADIERRAQALARKRNFALKAFCAYEGCELTVATAGSDRVASLTAPPPPVEIPGRLQVLVVDDDPTLRLVITAALKRDGYRVQEAADGEEALGMIGEQPPDLVLLDLGLPRVDGMAVLRQVRAAEKTSALPVILLTALADLPHTQAGFAAGATDYLTKPFTVPQLLARVRACIVRSVAAGGSRAAGVSSST
jgi:CheY-like chemotaxis protein